MSIRNTLFAALILLAIAQPAFARPDTVYFDQDWKKIAGKEQASYYGTRKQLPDKTYEAMDYYMNGTLQMSGKYKFRDTVRDGYFTYYNEKGLKTSEGLYKMDKHEGEWKYYRSDEEVIWFTQIFSKDILQGSFKSYYRNGKLKREELYKDGERVSGKRYSGAGAEMAFTPFNLPPVSSVDLPEYLRANIKYPKECQAKKIGGRVVLKFVVNTDGVVENIKVVTSAHPLLDAEAIRVIAAMPAWRPGQTDDVPVKVFHTLPIKFTP